MKKEGIVKLLSVFFFVILFVLVLFQLNIVSSDNSIHTFDKINELSLNTSNGGGGGVSLQNTVEKPDFILKYRDLAKNVSFEKNSLNLKKSTKVDSASITEIQESKLNNHSRSFEVRKNGEVFVPNKLKGTSFNNYFKQKKLDNDVYFRVQFEGQEGDPTTEQLRILKEDGIKLFDYHGDHIYFAKGKKEVLETKSYDFIRWVDVLDSESKINFDFEQDNSFNVTLRFFEELSEDQLALIRNISESYEYEKPFMNMNIFNLNKKDVQLISSFNFIERINKHFFGRTTLDRSSQVIAADYVWDYPNDASGITIGSSDSGINHSHTHFSSLNIYDAYDFVDDDTNPEADTHGHGTNVAGILAGEGTYNGRNIKGISYNANLVIQRIINNADDIVEDPMFDLIWDDILDLDSDANFDEVNSPDIISVSWVYGINSAYSDQSEKVDEVVNGELSGGKGIVVVIGSGNSQIVNTVSSPGSSKNGITVGASADYYSSDNYDGSGRVFSDPDNLYVMNYSARNVSDGRVKPDILAPGSDISTTSLGGSILEGGDGTSYASPHVSGVAAQILKQYPDASPSAVKAFLLSDTVGGSTTDNINTNQGWGRLNAYRALYKSAEDYIDAYDQNTVDENFLTPTPATRCYRVDVPGSSDRLVATLVWDDKSGDASGDDTKTLYNDLDLWLEYPNGTTLSWTEDDDDINNVEKYIIEDPVQGSWDICVSEISIYGIGGSQDYAINYQVIKRTTTPSIDLELFVDDTTLSLGQNASVYATIEVNGLSAYDLLADINVSNGLNITSSEFDGSDKDKDRIGDIPVGGSRVTRIWNLSTLSEGQETITINVTGKRIDGEVYSVEESITLFINNETPDIPPQGSLTTCTESGYEQCYKYSFGDCNVSLAINDYSENEIRFGEIVDSSDPYVINNYTFGWKLVDGSETFSDVYNPGEDGEDDCTLEDECSGDHEPDTGTEIKVEAPGIASRENIVGYNLENGDACWVWFNSFNPNYGESNSIYVLGCYDNGDCSSGEYCEKLGAWDGWRCLSKKADGQFCTNDGECNSGYCDNDGVGLGDDGLCFTPYNTYFDGQENLTCEYSSGYGDIQCDEKQVGIDGCGEDCKVSLNAPGTSTMIFPNGGESFNKNSLINITWTLSLDLNKDFVRYFLEFSNDSGSNWFPIISNYGYINKFNDSVTSKELVFDSNGNQTIYVRIPKNATVTRSSIRMEGLPR